MAVALLYIPGPVLIPVSEDDQPASVDCHLQQLALLVKGIVGLLVECRNVRQR